MASDESPLDKLINQCRNNDVDVKVDALTKLQAEFEAGVEINDADGLINVLKTCLRTSNQHLTAATLSALPPLFPLLLSRTVANPQRTPGPASASSSTSSVAASRLIDAVTLRQVLVAFLPAGGIIERLGDKGRAQVKARESLVILGGLAFRSGSGSGSTLSKSSNGKATETPLMIFERYLREGGLASKVWKVREQSILVLVHIRRSHHQFPIRPYLVLLVECLEDTDSHVRDCARQSIVELFSGPGVTDGARADLKEKMVKKGVRKTIVDGVLSKLLGGGASGQMSPGLDASETSDSGIAKVKEYIPPSLALQGRRPTAGTSGSSTTSRTASQTGSRDGEMRPASRSATVTPPPPPTPGNESADVRPVYIASTRDLENEFAAMAKPFEGKETEHNWAAREQAILRVRGMLKGDVHLRYTEAFLLALKDGFIQWSLKALASLRTTVSANTCSMYTELAAALEQSMDPFCETLLTNLLKMAGFTKKIAAQQSQASVTALLVHTSAQPRIVLPLLWNTLQEKMVQSRAAVVAHLKIYLETHATRSRHVIENSGGVETLEKAVKKALGDANPAVRENARVLFWVFEEVWRDRGRAILDSLDSVARKQLEKVCPNPELASDLPPTTPKATKKSSVAAAIAASRAKAKAIATAPPTLRHQATSAAHAPARRVVSPSVSPRDPAKDSARRPASPLRMSTSPPSSRSRIVSTMARSVSSSVVPSHARTPSEDSSPPSPIELSYNRRTSSPLVPPAPSPTQTLRKAMTTALPSSPTHSTGHISPTPRAKSRYSNGSSRTSAAPLPGRQSTMFGQFSMNDESLLMAQTIPIPNSDSDSDGDNSVNLMSFSAPFEMYPPITPKSNSQARSFSQTSDESKPTAELSTVVSSDSVADMKAAAGAPVVEDALRARAEQAESAAERLLELVEPEDDVAQHPVMPASLLVGNNANVAPSTPKPKPKPSPIPISQKQVEAPATPANRAAAIMRQAAMFQDSPAHTNKSTSLLDSLQNQRHETGWWLKRKTLVAQGSPLKLTESSDRVQELQGYVASLENGEADVHVLQKLALLCVENPAAEVPTPPLSPALGHPMSPSPRASRSAPSLHPEIWEKNKNFERLFDALVQYLDYTRSEEEYEYGLIVLWEMLENQATYLEGREADLFSVLLRVRYCNKRNVLEATNTIRDALTMKIGPVYGLTTIHASLRAFYMEEPPPVADEDIKAAAYAFGLIALGKFILRLPAEIAEEELPRLKGTLISALNNKSSLIVRESAAAAIISAQLVLQDETHLFTLLDGLADEKKNLLTYLFDKHGARGAALSGPNGKARLEKELQRLDTRTNSLRPRAAGVTT